MEVLAAFVQIMEQFEEYGYYLDKQFEEKMSKQAA